MSTFADSSALVKLYADEPCHTEIRRMAALVVSVLARVEVPAAIWRKRRSGDISAEIAAVLVAEFEADFYGTETDPPMFAAVVVDDKVLADAARQCAVHGLRAYDSVQLASALAARRAEPACTGFAAFDADLRAAATLESFDVVPQRM